MGKVPFQGNFGAAGVAHMDDVAYLLRILRMLHKNSAGKVSSKTDAVMYYFHSMLKFNHAIIANVAK